MLIYGTLVLQALALVLKNALDAERLAASAFSLGSAAARPVDTCTRLCIKSVLPSSGLYVHEKLLAR